MKKKEAKLSTHACEKGYRKSAVSIIKKKITEGSQSALQPVIVK